METNDLWEALGSLEGDQAVQVLILLFSRYEARLEHNPADAEASTFFQLLSSSLEQVHSCNVSRR